MAQRMDIKVKMGVYGRAGESVVHFFSTISQVTARLKTNVILKPSATDANCWMLHVASVCTPCCMLLSVVGSCCAKFETGQTFNTKYLIVCHKIGLVDACFTVQLFESLFTESVYSQSYVCLYK